MEDKNTQNFSLIKRAKSFTHAGRGLWIFLKTTHNAWVHLCVLVLAMVLGVYFGISNIEFVLIIFAGGLVLAAEAFNTAIEIDMDLTSPDPHPHARDTKDVAAGAVLIASVAALLVGVLIFWPYVVVYFAS